MPNEIDPVSKEISLAAMGANRVYDGDVDFGKPVLEAMIQACDSLLGQRDSVDALPPTGAKGTEAMYQMVQHVAISSACRFIWAEMGYAASEYHPKPVVDAKLRSELRYTRAAAKGILDHYEIEESKNAEDAEDVDWRAIRQVRADESAKEAGSVKKPDPAPIAPPATATDAKIVPPPAVKAS